MQARRSLALLIILTVFTFSIDPAGAAGRSASSIPNTILSGKGAPTLKVGINGDFYIDTRSLLIYGPKKNDKWSSPKNLQGPAGAAGANGNDGKSGSDGKNGSDGKSVAGVSTTAGPAGPADQSEPPVLLALLVHQVQSVQQDLPEPLVHQEVVQELLDRKAQLVPQDHKVQRELRVRQALRVQTEQLVQLDR